MQAIKLNALFRKYGTNKLIVNIMKWSMFACVYKEGTIVMTSSKELGFFNPRSQLESTVMTYCPVQFKNGEDR